MLRCLIRGEGNLTSANVVEQLGCSKPTALKWMRELAATELCEFHNNETGSNRPDCITLDERFDFLVQNAVNSEKV